MSRSPSLQQWIEKVDTGRAAWYEFPDGSIDHPEVLEQPRSVAVVVNRGCASSCEQFLLAAQQSTKVTIFGTRTVGILDFGNVRSVQMPEDTLALHYPTTGSTRLPHDPVDPHGIQPHVRIPDDELDAIEWALTRVDEAESGAR